MTQRVVPLADRPPEAKITGPHRGVFRWHASYTWGDGFGVEAGSTALTRRGIERKAVRRLRRLERDREASRHPTIMRSEEW